MLKLVKPLPGKFAQLEMAPASRSASLREESSPPNGAVDAGVLVLLTPVNDGRGREELLEWKVLLIRRNSYPGVHSGQIAFPGGRCELTDDGFCDTACREAYEEVGIDKDQLEIIGSLTSIYVPASNFVMHPFLAVDRAAQAIHLDPREAVDGKNIPIKEFDPRRAIWMEFEYSDGQRRPAPAWEYEGFVIWGATAMVLAELFRLVDYDSLEQM